MMSTVRQRGRSLALTANSMAAVAMVVRGQRVVTETLSLASSPANPSARSVMPYLERV